MLPPRVAEALLEEAVSYYVAALLTNLKAVSDEDLGRIRRDAAKLRDFFARFTKPEKVGWGSGRGLLVVGGDERR